MSPLTVLCYGHDSLLLETRRQVLATRFHALSASTLTMLAAASTAGEEISLLILCHSAQGQDAQQAAESVRAAWPACQVITLTLPRRSSEVLEGEVLWGLTDPVTLLRKVAEMLAPQSFGSTPIAVEERSMPFLAQPTRAAHTPV